MYTRRYPPRSRSELIPPPDYSGTAIRFEEEPIAEEDAGVKAQISLPRPKEEPLIPPPPMTYEENDMPGEAGEGDDGRLSDGASRRPDLDAPQLPPQPRFSVRSPKGRAPRRRLRWRRTDSLASRTAAPQTAAPQTAAPQTSTEPRRPIRPPLTDEGYRPAGGRPHSASVFAPYRASSVPGSATGWLSTLGTDEWLLIGLLVLLLTGSEREVKGHLDLILLLGVLLLIGK